MLDSDMNDDTSLLSFWESSFSGRTSISFLFISSFNFFWIYEIFLGLEEFFLLFLFAFFSIFTFISLSILSFYFFLRNSIIFLAAHLPIL